MAMLLLLLLPLLVTAMYAWIQFSRQRMAASSPTPQLVAMPKQERQTDRSNANRRSAGPPVRRPSTISTTSSGGKSSTMSRLSVYDDDDDDDDDDEEEEEVELGENAEGNFRRRTGRRRRSATTQQTEDSEVDSEAEETFTPFAPASMPPALVKPTARAGGTTLSFARSASDGSDFYNQLEAEKERSAGAGADQTPRIPAAAESVSHSTSDRHLSLGDAILLSGAPAAITHQ
ncbi:hypothetical protein IE81DRAFT_332250 [Ceraceosorus guamensis]|uniref:Uncharacterized protein n=1 Tax=Ceraceosorus guamensis TaxID=1522189 RepID=A0A316VPJ8_9BASI|nr:hypothetical protein IE81DRAFT_332250 [Ceraceosorus guamensis]PWN39569.1 hypothetical protein IE81DRAFT_332250 [Ceraceosorus guamensis]